MTHNVSNYVRKYLLVSIHIYLFGSFLQVVTLVGEPFVFIKSMPESGKCSDLDDLDQKRKHVRCTGKVYGEHAKLVSADQNEHCCYGMSVRTLSHTLLFLHRLTKTWRWSSRVKLIKLLQV